MDQGTRGTPSAQRMLVHVFLGLVAVQFFLAGLGVFRNNPKPDDKIVETSTFDAHRILGDVLTLISLVVLIVALVTRRSRELAGLLFGLMIVQNLLAGFGEDAPFLGGLHALNALVIVAVAVLLLLRLRPPDNETQAAPATTAP
jgi:hypothetical protein